MKLAQITKQLIFNQLQTTPPPPLEKEGKRMAHKKQEARSKKQEVRGKRTHMKYIPTIACFIKRERICCGCARFDE